MPFWGGRHIGAVALAATLATAGCSSSSNAGPTPSTPPANTTTTTFDAAAIDAQCPFLTVRQVTALFGRRPDQVTPRQIGIGLSCTYADELAGISHTLVVTISTGTGIFLPNMIPNATLIKGLGDRALIAPHSFSNALIVMFTRKAATYTITYNMGSAVSGRTVEPAKQANQLLQMVKAAASRLK